MEDNENQFKSLLESATEYGKTSFDLAKLKTIDKISDITSTLIPQTIIVVIIGFVLFFINVGFGFWLGEILGKTYYGFFVVAAFYSILGIVIHFIMRKWLKRKICNNIIKQMLK